MEYRIHNKKQIHSYLDFLASKSKHPFQDPHLTTNWYFDPGCEPIDLVTWSIKGIKGFDPCAKKSESRRRNFKKNKVWFQLFQESIISTKI